MCVSDINYAVSCFPSSNIVLYRQVSFLLRRVPAREVVWVCVRVSVHTSARMCVGVFLVSSTFSCSYCCVK